MRRSSSHGGPSWFSAMGLLLLIGLGGWVWYVLLIPFVRALLS